MQLKNLLDILAAVVVVVTAVNVGRTNIKKRTIEDQKILIATLSTRVRVLEEEAQEKDERICNLEEAIDGYTELVRQGHISGNSGSGSGNRSTSSKTTKNRTP
jgi:hypothetical protein